MIEGTNISREELLELAAADAIGALGEVDAARFERAFDAASPSLQSELRSLQERIAADPMFLSAEHPAASLRLKVLARVASAMDEASAKPIATIGPASASTSALRRDGSDDRDALLRELLERSTRESRPTQHVWRAAALFLFAALMVALYFNAEQRRISDRLIGFIDRQLTDEAGREIARMAAGFDTTSARELVVRDANGAPVQHIHAFLDAESKRVFVYGMGVTDPARAVIVRAGGSDSPLTLAASTVLDRGFAVMFAMPESRDGVRLEIGGSTYTIQA